MRRTRGDDGPQWPKRHTQEERRITLTRDDARTAEADGAEHRIDFALPVVLDRGAPMTSSTYAAQFMELLRLSADDRLLKAMKQPLAVFKRETYRLGLKCLTRTIDSTDLHTLLFTPVGDQLDANDDLHGDLGTAIAVLKS